MGTVYVARSAKLCKWASDVGLSKYVFKLGYTETGLRALSTVGWAGETDWNLVNSREVASQDENALISRFSRKENMIDPNLYPKLRGTIGIFKVLPLHVENDLIVQRAMASESELREIKLKPVDFANYIIKNALG